MTAELVGIAESVTADGRLLEALARFGSVDSLPPGDIHQHAVEHHELTGECDLWEALDVIALEVAAEGRNYGKGWYVTGWTIVTGTGGPHCELRVRSSGDASAWVFWGTDSVNIAGGRLDALAQALAGWMEDTAA